MSEYSEAEVNHILQRNRIILRAKFEAGKTISNRDGLIRAGFNFSFFTKRMQHQDRPLTIDFTFDYGIIEIQSGNFEILSIWELIGHKKSHIKRGFKTS